jgi:hypothetical protein
MPDVSSAPVRRFTNAYRLGMAACILSSLLALSRKYPGRKVNLSLSVLWSVLGYRPQRT